MQASPENFDTDSRLAQASRNWCHLDEFSPRSNEENWFFGIASHELP
jgi:hypothetical protein